MADEPKRPASPPRQAKAPPPRTAPPAELLPGDMKTRAPEAIQTAKPQMHPIQRRPALPETE
ncbi:hypothetical protein ACRQ5Q_22250 [Bradyrhizobium sp. PMVTL-01]|uniref:hypothetical protein n=1 Tax=Bradyrhizobium sp. PMVTL-01 TaxID=3434999 RepID=UPI003F6FE52D